MEFNARHRKNNKQNGGRLLKFCQRSANIRGYYKNTARELFGFRFSVFKGGHLCKNISVPRHVYATTNGLLNVRKRSYHVPYKYNLKTSVLKIHEGVILYTPR